MTEPGYLTTGWGGYPEGECASRLFYIRQRPSCSLCHHPVAVWKCGEQFLCNVCAYLKPDCQLLHVEYNDWGEWTRKREVTLLASRETILLYSHADYWTGWHAIDDGSYDGAGSEIGYGRTESEAIEDLFDALEAA